MTKSVRVMVDIAVHYDHIGRVMVSIAVSIEIDHGSHTEKMPKKMVFSASRRKSKDWLARNQDMVYK